MVSSTSLDFWKAKLSANYGLVENEVRKYFKTDPENAEEALSDVFERLVEDDMRRLRLYDPGRGAKFETYLSLLVQRLISKFLSRKRKRLRFPKWLERQNNSLWFLVYQLLCWELKSETDVVEYLRTSAPGGRSVSTAWEAIRIIRERFPNCGKPPEKEISTDREDGFTRDVFNSESAFHNLSPEEQVALRQRIVISQTVLSASEYDLSSDSVYREMGEVREKLDRKFRLTPQKSLFLKLIYQDGMRVSEAGREIGWNANQAAGHHRRLMEQLRDILGDDFLV